MLADLPGLADLGLRCMRLETSRVYRNSPPASNTIIISVYTYHRSRTPRPLAWRCPQYPSIYTPHAQAELIQLYLCHFRPRNGLNRGHRLALIAISDLHTQSGC